MNPLAVPKAGQLPHEGGFCPSGLTRNFFDTSLCFVDFPKKIASIQLTQNRFQQVLFVFGLPCLSLGCDEGHGSGLETTS